MRSRTSKPPAAAIRFQLLIAGTCCGALVGHWTGCAQENPAITARPTAAELPEIKGIERTIPAAVTVENRGAESRVRLVPDFKEPELTAEEQAALGLQPIHYKFLLYNELSRPVGSRVGNWFGGVATGSEGYVHVSGLHDPRSRLTGVAGWAGAATGQDTVGSHVSGTYEPRDITSTAGPRSSVIVETENTPSRVAERKPRAEP